MISWFDFGPVHYRRWRQIQIVWSLSVCALLAATWRLWISQEVFQKKTVLPNLETVLGEQLRYLKEIEELVISENALCKGAAGGVEVLMDPPHLEV